MASSFQLFDLDTPPAARPPFHSADEVASAAAYCFSAAQAFWEARCDQVGTRLPLTPLPGGFASEPRHRIPEARQVGAAAAKLPPEQAAYAIASLYSARLSPSTKAKYGVYYTPPLLVDRLLGQVTAAGLDWADARTLDPACGGGAFLAPVAVRLVRDLRKRRRNPAQIVDHVSRHLVGVEFDPVAAWLAQVSAEAAMLDVVSDARIRLGNIVRTADSLGPDAFAPDERFDLVVGNPPYGRVTLPPELREQFRASLYGHANYYGIFTHLALNLANAGGLLAYVTPSSFLGGQYFQNLRLLLSQQARCASVDFITDRSGVFDDVLQETLLVVFQKTAPRDAQRGSRAATVVSSLTPSAGARSCHIEAVGTFQASARPGKPWLFPRSRRQAALLRSAGMSRFRLCDYGYRVSTGPLVWNRHKGQLRERQSAGCLPIIWSEAVGTGGEFRFSSARRNHKPFFYVHPGQSHLVTGCGCILVQRTTAKEQARRIVAAYMPPEFVREHGGAVIENHLNMILPTRSGAVPAESLIALLNSATIDEVFRCISGSVAVSAYELESMPLPDPEILFPGGRPIAPSEQLIQKAYEGSR